MSRHHAERLARYEGVSAALRKLADEVLRGQLDSAIHAGVGRGQVLWRPGRVSSAGVKMISRMIVWPGGTSTSRCTV